MVITSFEKWVGSEVAGKKVAPDNKATFREINIRGGYKKNRTHFQYILSRRGRLIILPVPFEHFDKSRKFFNCAALLTIFSQSWALCNEQ